MSGRNWNRPRDRLRGKATERITGDDLSGLLIPQRPGSPRLSKEELRRRGDQALEDWKRRQQPAEPSVDGGDCPLQPGDGTAA
jgi:hypothetical protein